jgi:PAS domain S-box-containing protein
LVSGEELGYSGDPGQWGFDIKRDLVCVSDARGYFVSLNKAWEESLGGTRAELQSRPYMELVHDDDVERTRREAARAVEPDYEIVDFENRFRHKDGSYRWLRWSARSDGDQLFAVAFDVTERKRDEERLLRTLTEDHLLAYSQPIMEQRSRRIEHEELLVRMRGDAAGDVVLLPEAFLPAAEQLGFIGIVDRWMLDRAIAVAASGRRMEINLSARSISDANLVNDLCAAVDAAPQSARRLTFEITETAAIENLDAAREFTERLLPLGCRFALDDFGTGFGSLTYLRRLPVELLKIDTTFVHGMVGNGSDRALVRSVVAIARELGLETVAEGVEDEATLELLREYGVDHVQGYLIGRPEPVFN